MADYILADTTVISHLTKASKHSEAYQELIGERRLAISFQTIPELRSAQFSETRRQRIDDLLKVTLVLPHAESTDVWYARVVQTRKELKRLQSQGSDASDADVWIISSALEHRLPLLSHDRQQVGLARASGVAALTNLNGLKDSNPKL